MVPSLNSARPCQYSRYFVKFLGWYTRDDALYIAMEYIPGGDLHSFITRESVVSESDSREITGQVCTASQPCIGRALPTAM